MIFIISYKMNEYSFIRYKRASQPQTGRNAPSLLRVTLEYQRRISSAEPEAVRKSVLHFRLTGRVRDIVQIAIGVGKFVVDRWGQFILFDREHRENPFDPAGCTKSMPGHR